MIAPVKKMNLTIELSRYFAEELLDELKDQAGEIAWRLANDHNAYKDGSCIHDTTSARIMRTADRIQILGEAMKKIEDALEEKPEPEPEQE